TVHYSETIISNPQSMPKYLDPAKPSLVKNIYNSTIETIDSVFTLDSHFLDSWPKEYRHLFANVHVVECGGEKGFSAPVPTVHWISNSRGSIKFNDAYVNAIKSGHSCQIMISIMEQIKICDESIKIDGGLLENSVLIDIGCSNTENIHCDTE